MITTEQIRSLFIDFYKGRGHTHVASSGLVPHTDPSLLFTNSGMVQFKGVLTGEEQRDYQRAVTAQKCMRAGGKHNDLENVGYTARHHTFFEMLGNFSFGDYFKDYAIECAWDLVTKELGIAKDKLLVTVYIDDDDAAEIWKKVAGISDDRIIRIAGDDNFWQMGEFGPCGPCSEIFYDHGEGVFGGPPGSKDADGDRFCEIWNLVFMQYERRTDGSQIDLPKPSIDTGMGLERVAAVMQGVQDNYDTDGFVAIISHLEELLGKKASGGDASSFKVIADHIRASGFLLSEGVVPQNEGRGYVLRRIMRRMMRHANKLGADAPLIYRAIPTFVRLYSGAYPELASAEDLITETVRFEEERFGKLLTRGMKRLNDASKNLHKGMQLDGKVAFELYDTYGFPLDLVSDVMRERDITVDQKAFDESMTQQRERARKSWRGGEYEKQDKIWLELSQSAGKTEFLGYSDTSAEGEVLAIVQGDKQGDKAGDKQSDKETSKEINKEISKIDAASDARVGLIFNQTPFYGELGGQTGDTGILSWKNGETKGEFRVEACTRAGDGLYVHWGRVTKGTLHKQQAVRLVVDADRRSRIMSHHSSVHLMFAALRQVLGPHIAQRGSEVTDKTLRFDFSHPKALEREELEEVERLVNEHILDNTLVVTRLMEKDAAIAMGATAMFGEKYPDEVRVVSMGGTASGADGKRWSVELCGGTHVARSGDIGALFVRSESAIAAGIRRIEAVAGMPAALYARQQLSLAQDASRTLNIAPEKLNERIGEILDINSGLRKEVKVLKEKMSVDKAQTETIDIAGLAFRRVLLQDFPAADLKGFARNQLDKLGKGVVAVASRAADRASLVVMVDGWEELDANALVKAGAQKLGGSGGGRRDSAQAGGPDAQNAAQALDEIANLIAKQTAK